MCDLLAGRHQKVSFICFIGAVARLILNCLLPDVLKLVDMQSLSWSFQGAGACMQKQLLPQGFFTCGEMPPKLVKLLKNVCVCEISPHVVQREVQWQDSSKAFQMEW